MQYWYLVKVRKNNYELIFNLIKINVKAILCKPHKTHNSTKKTNSKWLFKPVIEVGWKRRPKCRLLFLLPNFFRVSTKIGRSKSPGCRRGKRPQQVHCSFFEPQKQNKKNLKCKNDYDLFWTLKVKYNLKNGITNVKCLKQKIPSFKCLIWQVNK